MASKKEDIIIPLFMPVEKISKRVGIGENRIRKMIQESEIDYIVCGNRKLLTLDAFIDWYNNHKIQAVNGGEG